MPSSAGVTTPEEYVNFITSLYGNRQALLQGLAGHLLCFGVVFWQTLDPMYLYACMVLAVTFLLRMAKMKVFDRIDKDSLDAASARRWEYAYIIGSATTTATLGVTGGYSLFLQDSPLATAIGMATSMTALVAVIGRNFGSTANIKIVTLAAIVPAAIGMAFSGSPYAAVAAVAFLPMYFSTVGMANGVRAILRDAFLSGREAQEVADQFEAALNNMPHGLIMLDIEKKVAVANGQAGALLGFPDDMDLRGHSLKAIIRLGVARGRVSREDGRRMLAQFNSLISGRSTRETIEIAGETFYDVSAQLREKKGVVLNFENVTERHMGQRKIIQLARYDSLSNLPNRYYLAELVADAVAGMDDGALIAFSVFDIDRFKQINDTMGHLAGDRVIQQVGQRLLALSDSRAICARLGGDEFVIAIPGVRKDEDLPVLLDSIYGSISGQFVVNGRKMEVNVSGGVIVYPKDRFSLDEALIKADLALYTSKKEERTSWTLFADSMDEEFRHQQMLKKELQKALREGGLSAAYQPMLTADGLSIACCEALARWEHPKMGFIPPSSFIKVAEEMGLIGEVTRQIVNTACRDCMAWPEEMGVSVNLSAIDIGNPEIVGVIRAALETSGLAPSRLQVEVTESVLVDDRERAGKILEQIKALGVKLALDDFGTGYSSLSYLHDFPLDKIKIDRKFVEKIVVDLKARQVLRAMIRLSRDLGFEIVVEGIETEAQLDVLRSIGSADLVQGYVFGRPMKPELVPGFVADVNVRQLRSATVLRIGDAGARKAVPATA